MLGVLALVILVASVWFVVEIVIPDNRGNGRPGPVTNNDAAQRTLWERNWNSIQELSGGTLGTGGGTFKNRERLLSTLGALDFSQAPVLEEMRQQLIQDITDGEMVTVHGPSYNLRYTQAMKVREQEIRRGVRDRAIGFGIDVSRGP